MKIALIVDNLDLKSTLTGIFSPSGWKIDFFQGSVDFGTTHLSEYDVIVADIDLKPIGGRQILQSIKNKTEAELYLMGEGSFPEIDINNEHIQGFINRNNIEDLLDKIKYVEIKKRLQNSAAKNIV